MTISGQFTISHKYLTDLEIASWVTPDSDGIGTPGYEGYNYSLSRFETLWPTLRHHRETTVVQQLIYQLQCCSSYPEPSGLCRQHSLGHKCKHQIVEMTIHHDVPKEWWKYTSLRTTPGGRNVIKYRYLYAGETQHSSDPSTNDRIGTTLTCPTDHGIETYVIKCVLNVQEGTQCHFLGTQAVLDSTQKMMHSNLTRFYQPSVGYNEEG